MLKILISIVFSISLQAQNQIPSIGGGGAGSGDITDVIAGCGVSGGASSGAATVASAITVNAQTGTTYTYLQGDCGKIIVHTNGSSIAATLPQAGSGGNFASSWYIYVQNIGAGTVTITPTTSTIDGASTLVLRQNKGTILVSDGTNYFTLRGLPTLVLADLPSIASTNLSDTSNLVRNNASNTFSTGDQDFSSASTLKVPVAAGATATVNGRVKYDSTADMLHAAQGGADAYIPQATITPIDADCAKWVVSGSKYKLGSAGTPCGAGGGSGATLFSAVGTGTGPSNSASEISIIPTVAVGSKTIPANTFTDGALLEVKASGRFSLPTVADALTVKYYCGSTVLGTGTTTLAAGAITNGVFRADATISASGSGASGNLIVNTILEFTSSAETPSEVKVLNSSLVAFDFTTSCAFEIKAQWGAGQSGEEILGTGVAAYIPGAPVTSVNGMTGAVVITSGLVLLEQHTASSSATLNFTTCISSTYDEYEIEVLNVIPASGSTNLLMRMGTGGGPTYDSTSGHYFWDGLSWRATSNTFNGGGSDTSLNLTALNGLSTGTDSKYGVIATLRLYSPGSTAFYKEVLGKVRIIYNDNATVVMGEFGGRYQQTTAVTAFQFLFDTGSIASGIIRCYGLAK